jgi:hypothetical protein
LTASREAQTGQLTINLYSDGHTSGLTFSGGDLPAGIPTNPPSAPNVPAVSPAGGDDKGAGTASFPVFTSWKGAEAQDALRIFWEVAPDKDFILTMYAENGTFDPYRKHPNRNRDGSRDYSFGLNSRYHWPMIERIQNREASLKEIAEYHYRIYSGKEWTTSCGRKPFCGYNHRNKNKSAILFPEA